MTDTPETTIPGERAQTTTARKVDNNPLLKRGAVVLAVVAFMGFAMWSMRQGPKEDVEQPGSGVIRQTTQFEPARVEPEPVTLPIPEIKLPTPAVETAEGPAVDELLEAARRAPVMAFGGGQSSNSAKQSSTVDATTDSNFLPVEGMLGGGGRARTRISASTGC